MQSMKPTYKLWSNQMPIEEDALEPDVIEIPADDQRERDDGTATGARIIVLNPRGDSEGPTMNGAFDEVLSPWDILHLRWRLRERLSRWREESSETLSQFERASKSAAVAYLKTFGPTAGEDIARFVLPDDLAWPGGPSVSRFFVANFLSKAYLEASRRGGFDDERACLCLGVQLNEVVECMEMELDQVKSSYGRRISRPNAGLTELANLVYETDELEIPQPPAAGEIFRELLLALAQSQGIEIEGSRWHQAKNGSFYICRHAENVVLGRKIVNSLNRLLSPGGFEGMNRIDPKPL